MENIVTWIILNQIMNIDIYRYNKIMDIKFAMTIL